MAKKYTAAEIKQLDQFATGVFGGLGIHRDMEVNITRIKQSYDMAELMLEESKYRASLEAYNG